ncbi:MAG TPA: hypothetical protein VMB51_04205 [Solirubrobacteraceae bacterium]|nr:hypothetical protein [Solirubrobacteraceae bacterium]
MNTAADMSTLYWALTDEPRSRTARAIAVVRRGYEPLPQWLVPVADRIAELAELDTVNRAVERPLNIEDVLDTLSFLKRVMREDTRLPWIGRLTSGGVELAWKHGDVEVEAVFDRLRGDRELLVSVGDRDWDAPADKGDSLFASVVDRLSNSYIEHACGASPAVACA